MQSPVATQFASGSLDSCIKAKFDPHLLSQGRWLISVHAIVMEKIVHQQMKKSTNLVLSCNLVQNNYALSKYGQSSRQVDSFQPLYFLHFASNSPTSKKFIVNTNVAHEVTHPTDEIEFFIRREEKSERGVLPEGVINADVFVHFSLYRVNVGS